MLLPQSTYINILVRGWRILTPHEDKDENYDDDDDDHDDCKCGATSGLGRTCFFSNLGILQYLTCKSKIETDACKVLVFQVCSLGIPKPQPRIAAVTISISGPSCGAVPRHGILRGQPGAQR